MNPEDAEAPLPSEAPTNSQALTAPTAPNRSPAAGRQQGLFHGYRMTDDVLFHPWLTTTEKLVLGAFAAHPRRSPSHRYLRAHTPVHHDSIEAALSRIEEVFGLAIFDRPHGPQDRDPITRRFARPNRAMMLAPAADPARPENARRSVVLPARIAAKLRRGQRNSGLTVLVALLYVREQLRRGAIQADDEAVAAMLHTEARKVRRIREQMIRDSVLVRAKKAPGSAIYTMPGATARTPAAADLDVTRTRRLRLLPIDIGTPIYALANDREWSAIQSALAQTPTTGHALAVTEAWLSDARQTPTGASIRPSWAALRWPPIRCSEASTRHDTDCRKNGHGRTRFRRRAGDMLTAQGSVTRPFRGAKGLLPMTKKNKTLRPALRAARMSMTEAPNGSTPIAGSAQASRPWTQSWRTSYRHSPNSSVRNAPRGGKGPRRRSNQP